MVWRMVDNLEKVHMHFRLLDRTLENIKGEIKTLPTKRNSILKLNEQHSA
jgi:hypothetical protein